MGFIIKAGITKPPMPLWDCPLYKFPPFHKGERVVNLCNIFIQFWWYFIVYIHAVCCYAPNLKLKVQGQCHQILKENLECNSLLRKIIEPPRSWYKHFRKHSKHSTIFREGNSFQMVLGWELHLFTGLSVNVAIPLLSY